MKKNIDRKKVRQITKSQKQIDKIRKYLGRKINNKKHRIIGKKIHNKKTRKCK